MILTWPDGVAFLTLEDVNGWLVQLKCIIIAIGVDVGRYGWDGLIFIEVDQLFNDFRFVAGSS